MNSSIELNSIFTWLGASMCIVGCVYLLLQHWTRRNSLDILSRRCTRNPKSFNDQHAYALALYCAGRLPHAELEFERALRLDPENAQCRFYLGSLLLLRGEKDEAITQLEMAIELCPLYAEAHATLGSARELKGDLVGAEREYQRAVKLDKTLANAHFNLARIYAICSDPEHSVKHLSSAINLADVYRHEAKTCTDFDKLCQRPEFQHVLYEAA